MKEKNRIVIIGNPSLSDQLSCVVAEHTKGLNIINAESITTADDIDFHKSFGVGSDAYLRHYENVKYLDEIRYSHLTKKEKEAIIVDIRREPKINRNSICPCGSGKKYKKCCLIKK